MADPQDPWALPGNKGVAKPPPPLSGSTASTPASSAKTPGSRGSVTPATSSPPPPPPPGYGQFRPDAKNWMGIVALVTSIVGGCMPFLAIGGIVFGHLGLSAVNRGEATNRGLALAGLIVGYSVLGLWTLFYALLFATSY